MKNLEELAVQLEKLCKETVGLNAQLQTDIVRVASQQEEAMGQREELEDIRKSLTDREKRVEYIESVEDSVDEAKRVQAENSIKGAELSAQEERLAESYRKNTAELQVAATKVRIDRETADASIQNAAKEQAQLKIDRQALKEKVIKEITGGK